MAKECHICGEPDLEKLYTRKGHIQPDPICKTCQRRKWQKRNWSKKYERNKEWDFLTKKWGNT